uniref:Transmembrane protein 98 n=1 Tax=Panagrolaimus davidi TaxID=227884 RepID=A0A914Q521_9BILA
MDKLAKIPLNSISPQLNDVICQATARVVPRFDDLLQSMAAPNVDVRLIEARVVALCCSCWSLVSPFYLMNPKYKEVFGQLINDMEAHQKCLQLAVEQATINATAGASGAATSSSGGNGNGGENGPPQATSSSSTTKTPTDQRKIIMNETSQSSPQAKGAKPSSQIISGSNNQLPHTVNNHRRTPPEQKRIINSVAQPITVSTTRTPPISLHQAPPPIIRNVRSASVSLHPTRDESRQELLDHEAPADPSA